MTALEQDLSQESEAESPKREPQIFAFTHWRDITRGKGRIVWEDGEGWKLLGGCRTFDEAVAIDAALAIDEMIR